MVQAHARELLNQKETQPHPLISATERLVAALDRLERNLEQGIAAKPVDTADSGKLAVFEQENENLRAEREALSEAITQMENRYTDLHKAAGAIYNKLDDSIKRLTQIVGG